MKSISYAKTIENFMIIIGNMIEKRMKVFKNVSKNCNLKLISREKVGNSPIVEFTQRKIANFCPI